MEDFHDYLPGVQGAGLLRAVSAPAPLQEYYAAGERYGYCVIAARILDTNGRFSAVFEGRDEGADIDAALRERLDALMAKILGSDLILCRPELFGIPCYIAAVAPRIASYSGNQSVPDNAILHGFTAAAAQALGVRLQVFATKTYQRPSEYGLAVEELSLRYDAVQFFGIESDVVSFHYNDYYTAGGRNEDFGEAKLYYEKLFFNYIVSYRFPDACDVFLKIIDLELTSPETAISIKNRVPERLAWIMYVLGTPSREPGTPMKNNVMVAIKELGHIGSVAALKEKAVEIFRILEEDYCGEVDQNQSTFDRVSGYISEHYADFSLGSAMICDRFGITPAYLSRLFRRHTGLSMVDFIHGVRLSHLKELLLAGDETLGVLAPKCGYTSLWTMSRAFKKYEGITPGEYRSNYVVK